MIQIDSTSATHRATRNSTGHGATVTPVLPAVTRNAGANCADTVPDANRHDLPGVKPPSLTQA